MFWISASLSCPCRVVLRTREPIFREEYTITGTNNSSTHAFVWYVPGNGNGLPPGTASLAWGVDPTQSSNTPAVSSLTVGSTYSWSITVQDSNYNQATTVVNYEP